MTQDQHVQEHQSPPPRNCNYQQSLNTSYQASYAVYGADGADDPHIPVKELDRVVADMLAADMLDTPAGQDNSDCLEDTVAANTMVLENNRTDFQRTKKKIDTMKTSSNSRLPLNCCPPSKT